MIFSDKSNRSVATKDEILVPETLLKKRKSQEKEREAKAAEIQKRKKVSMIKVPYALIVELKS